MIEKTSHIESLRKWLNEEFTEPCDDSKDIDLTSESLRLELLLDCVIFVDKQGLMENEMELFVIFFNSLFNDMFCDGLHIDKAVVLLKEKINTFFRTYK